MRSWSGQISLVGSSLLAILLFAACGSGEAKNNVNLGESGPGVTVTVPSFTPVSSATPAGTRAAATGATAAAGGGQEVSAAGATTVVATDNKFDKTTLTVKANAEVTLIVDNKGAAIHNWRVLGIKNKDGKDIGTKLLPGGQKDTITFTIDKTGAYDYQCDVHPTEMKGKLTVQ